MEIINNLPEMFCNLDEQKEKLKYVWVFIIVVNKHMFMYIKIKENIILSSSQNQLFKASKSNFYLFDEHFLCL